MLCAEFERLEEGYRVDVEYIGYGNTKTLAEVFRMENIDLKRHLII